MTDEELVRFLIKERGTIDGKRVELNNLDFGELIVDLSSMNGKRILNCDQTAIEYINNSGQMSKIIRNSQQDGGVIQNDRQTAIYEISNAFQDSESVIENQNQKAVEAISNKFQESDTILNRAQNAISEISNRDQEAQKIYG